MVNEFAYCPRLFYLEYVLSEFQDNADTVEGRFRHRRVDRPSGALAVPSESGSEDASAATGESPKTPTNGSAMPLGEASSASANGGASIDLRSTSITLSAPELGAVARIDLIEQDGNRVVPVDYKRGRKPSIPEGAYEPERVQVCLQGLILRENGYQCDHGELYFTESKERVRVEFDGDLLDRTRECLRGARELTGSGTIPPPLEDSPKCPRCSLVGICLPDETNFLSAHRSGVEASEVRRLIPERLDAKPLYLQAQGLSVGKSGQVVQIREKGKLIQQVRMLDISQVAVVGNVQVSTQLVHELCRDDIPLTYFSYGGWFNGMTTGAGGRNVQLRIRQFRAAEDAEMSLHVSQRFVRGKILNGRTLLRRNHKSLPDGVLRELSRLSMAAGRTRDLPSLLGVEGSAAKLYFSHFGDLFRTTALGDLPGFDFQGRNRRPPKDPINCLLSFAYSMLVKDVTVTCQSVGFDPFVGFFHQLRPGRPGLALDLMEEFRPLICDSVVLQVVRTREITESDFIVRGGACALTPGGRRALIGAYERRMDASVTHPIFRYVISYRRVLEVQARLLARYLTGEIPEYPPFRTR
ncbi:MAG: CRISPR-associated endonuclease Cas1 [Candidatus Eisenbacteria bacterium]|uniref:CRISPR-associated endonuclease Cas1 n=1 Tax=Eiseniibacteriota bacterium TaxID=2212470 RepID=A0A956M4F0_UNCEI|nr:CRISPR-associated endonuclease Cas1 [Candidatus Eisenbacteria bacterium]